MSHPRGDVDTSERVGEPREETDEATLEYDPTPDSEDASELSLDPLEGAYKPVSQMSDEELESFARRVESRD